jgi:hypothetical protein
MAQVSISDVVVPAEFTAYQVENSFVSTAFYRSGVALPNAVIQEQLTAGAEFFTVPFWQDDGETEPNYSNDNPATLAMSLKIGAYPQVVRKAFVNQSWGVANLAAELSGSDPLGRIQARVQAYWDRQMEARLIASLNGILAANVANNSSDMVIDVTATSNPGFNAEAVIDAALTLGDRLEDIKCIAMHSSVYAEALGNDLIQFIPQSEGPPIKTFRGLAVMIDDNLWYSGTTPGTIKYVSVLFGYGAVGYGFAEPRSGYGTEIFRIPSAGMGGGITQLWSRHNLAIAPLGWSWTDGTLANDSPSLADLATASHWTRVSVSRKQCPIAFLLTK